MNLWISQSSEGWVFLMNMLYRFVENKKKKTNHPKLLLVNIKAKQIWNVLKIDFKLFFVKIYFSGATNYYFCWSWKLCLYWSLN